MNYMPEVAKMLGVELEEEFKINDDSTNKFKLTNSGLFWLNHVGVWGSCDHKLTQLLNGKHEIIKLPKSILTEEEKEYLSNVIKPFREDVLKISKFKSKVLKNKEVIGFETPNGFMIFPPFEKDKMYKNMELNKAYTLDDLGL